MWLFACIAISPRKNNIILTHLLQWKFMESTIQLKSKSLRGMMCIFPPFSLMLNPTINLLFLTLTHPLKNKNSEPPSKADMIIIIIWCGIDSGNVNGRLTTLSESYHTHPIMSMVTADYYYTDWRCPVDIFLHSGVEKLMELPGFEPTTLDLSSRSGTNNLSAMTTLASVTDEIKKIKRSI